MKSLTEKLRKQREAKNEQDLDNLMDKRELESGKQNGI